MGFETISIGSLFAFTVVLVVIAIEAGYGSEAAFTRAFARTYGVSPGAWRLQG